MKPITISLKPYYGHVYKNDGIFNFPEKSNPFFCSQHYFNTNGIQIATIDKCNADNSDVLVCCDVPYPWEITIWLKILIAKRKILINFESPIVNPFSQMAIFRNLFDIIFSWQTENKLPYQFEALHSKIVPFKKKKLLVAVSANKKPVWMFEKLSHYPSLYEIKLKMYRDIVKTWSNKFHLYGKGWKDSRLACVYKNTVRDKCKLLAKFKFSLVMENASANGYITEKLFDCFVAGCVPLYFGAPDVSDYIPKGCYIDLRKFSSTEQLMEFIDKMTEKKHDEYIAKIQKFINSPETLAEWSSQSFLNKIVISTKQLIYEKH